MVFVNDFRDSGDILILKNGSDRSSIANQVSPLRLAKMSSGSGGG